MVIWVTRRRVLPYRKIYHHNILKSIDSQRTALPRARVRSMNVELLGTNLVSLDARAFSVIEAVSNMA